MPTLRDLPAGALTPSAEPLALLWAPPGESHPAARRPAHQNLHQRSASGRGGTFIHISSQGSGVPRTQTPQQATTLCMQKPRSPFPCHTPTVFRATLDSLWERKGPSVTLGPANHKTFKIPSFSLEAHLEVMNFQRTEEPVPLCSLEKAKLLDPEPGGIEA